MFLWYKIVADFGQICNVEKICAMINFHLNIDKKKTNCNWPQISKQTRLTTSSLESFMFLRVNEKFTFLNWTDSVFIRQSCCYELYRGLKFVAKLLQTYMMNKIVSWNYLFRHQGIIWYDI